jgi:hypothetical protein
MVPLKSSTRVSTRICTCISSVFRLCQRRRSQQIYNAQWAKVGETSTTITGGGATQQFTYYSSQSSSLGLAVASSGWSEAGTHSMSSTSSIPFPTKGVDSTWVYQTEFRYGLYQGSCGMETQVYDYSGGGQQITAGAITLTHCATYWGWREALVPDNDGSHIQRRDTCAGPWDHVDRSDRLGHRRLHYLLHAAERVQGLRLHGTTGRQPWLARDQVILRA